MCREFTRRHLLMVFPFALAGRNAVARDIALANIDYHSSSIYGPINDPPFKIPALDLAKVDPDVLRQEVTYQGPYPPGTVIIKLAERRLYLIVNDGLALRFGIAVGRAEALNFHGSAIVGRKARWPTWTPTANMIARIPKYAVYAGGMRGGPRNPLGARALYLYRDGEDTNFRVHGTNEPQSIGKAASSGCIRLFNHDIVYLYNQVGIDTPVIVQHAEQPTSL
jgi:lipoprotein-anchoring transpeptidase ErfK/SrfK